MMNSNAVVLLAAYVCSVGGTLIWVFYSGQERVPRTKHTSQLIALRCAVIYSIVFVACWVAGISAWIPLAIVGILCGLVLAGDVLGIVGVPFLYVLQQYVLGFPDREELFLTAGASANDTDDELNSFVGKYATAVYALKPTGEVRIDTNTFPAASEGGDYIDAKACVVVTGVQNGKLVVRLSSE